MNASQPTPGPGSAIGMVLIAIGVVGLAIAIVKFSIIGYYPEDVVPFGAIGLVGAGLLALGNRIHSGAKGRG